jgi:hypothetical protein
MSKNKTQQYQQGTGRKRISIVVDGQTEIWYFEMMKKYHKTPFNIVPELALKMPLKKQYEKVVQKAEDDEYKIFWLLDLDDILKQDKEIKKGQKSKSQELKEYIKKLQKYKNVIICVNNPCLEFWLLLHFEATGKVFSMCEDAEKALKKYLPDYEKSEKYYKNPNNTIYNRLKNYQNVALQNAKQLGNFDFEDIKSAKAEIFKIVEILTSQNI